ncbi:MAG: hypothetical protein Kow0032_28740 [Methyloligellaceae bacterium]
MTPNLLSETSETLARLHRRVVLIRTAALGVTSRSADAAAETAAMVGAFDDALRDLADLKIQISALTESPVQRAPRASGFALRSDPGAAGLLSSPGPDDTLH